MVMVLVSSVDGKEMWMRLHDDHIAMMIMISGASLLTSQPASMIINGVAMLLAVACLSVRKEGVPVSQEKEREREVRKK